MKTAQQPKPKTKAIRSGAGKTKRVRPINGNGSTAHKTTTKKLVVEMYGGEPYEYYPLGKYVVSSPEVCRGRPTFKYTRINAKYALDLVAAGWKIEDIAQEWWGGKVSADAIREAILLGSELLDDHIIQDTMKK